MGGHRVRDLVLLGGLLLTLALGVVTCTGGPSQVSPPPLTPAKAPSHPIAQVPAEPLRPLWEVWGILQREFVDKKALDPQRLGQGAIQALLKAAGVQGEVPRPLASLLLPKGAPRELEPVWQVWTALFQRGLVEGKDPSALAQEAIRGLVDALDDPYTEYLSPDQFRLTQENLQGSYEGIGAEVARRDGRFILTPFPGSPAEKAGIRPGDVILEVDGDPVEGWTLLQLVGRIRGPRGTTVTLKVVNLDESEPRVVSITRGVIQVESVFLQMTPEGFAHIRIAAFYRNTDRSLTEALQKARQQGARGLILDLRNNAGGLLPTVVNVASQFLREGIVVSEVDGRGRRKEWPVRKGGLVPDLPMVVLVNQFSASGSEVLTGALQDYQRALVLGVPTFGKGSVNLLRPLSDGGGLYVTYARWYTPHGRLIEGKGLEPDILLRPSTDQKGDPLLEKARELLRQQVRASLPQG